MNLLIFIDPTRKKDYTKILDTIKDLEYNLTGFSRVDGVNNFGSLYGYVLYPLSHIPTLSYNFALLEHKVFIDSSKVAKIINAGVPADRIRMIYWLLKQKMIKKYEDVQDKDIQETLKYWQKYNLSVYNQHIASDKHTKDELHIDKYCGLPYIIFKTVEGKEKRMYYPRDSGVKGSDGKSYIEDVLFEQSPTSPHLYVKDNHKVNDGDILIDAGVCEGNFALKYVDVCSKIYLCETDTEWFAPLYFTFKDYMDKVEFVRGAVGNITDRGQVMLDDVINVPNGSNIFLKMDIEGAEIDALHGARKILQSNKVKASVCSYHRKDDCWKIKSIFQKYGYKTSTSEGYMIFNLDKDIWDTADFRKGIVYAENY